MNHYDLIAIIGPTATGKTRLAATLAHQIGGEVISADSRQVYRGMNLGTGKDYDDYIVDGISIPFHLVDIATPGEEYSLFRFRQDFEKAFLDIKSRHKIPILCGGSGMYIEAALGGYNLMQVPPNDDLRKLLETKSQQELTAILVQLKPIHNTTDTLDRERTLRAIEIAVYESENMPNGIAKSSINPLIFGINPGRELVRQRITQRLRQRLKDGMIEEVKSLIDSGISPDILDYYGLEYRYTTRYIQSQISHEQLFNQLNTAIHQFAKRQMTWFRRMEKKGFVIHWIDGDLNETDRLRACMMIIESKTKP